MGKKSSPVAPAPVVGAASQYVFEGHGKGARYPCLGGLWFPTGQPVAVTPEQAAIIVLRGLPLKPVGAAVAVDGDPLPTYEDVPAPDEAE